MTHLDDGGISVAEKIILRKIPSEAITVERLLLIEARTRCIDIFGLPPAVRDDCLTNIKRALNDDKGEYYKTPTGTPLPYADRKGVALNIIAYLETAAAYPLQPDNLLQVAMCFYVVDNVEAYDAPQNKYYSMKKAAIMSDSEAFIFFCNVGRSMLPSYKHLDTAQTANYLSVAEAMMYVAQPLLDLPN